MCGRGEGRGVNDTVSRREVFLAGVGLAVCSGPAVIASSVALPRADTGDLSVAGIMNSSSGDMRSPDVSSSSSGSSESLRT